MIRVTVKTNRASKNSDLRMACDNGSARVGSSEGAKAGVTDGELERVEETLGEERDAKRWVGVAVAAEILSGLTRTGE